MTIDTIAAPTPPKLHRRSYWVWLLAPDQDDTPPAARRIADPVLVEVTYQDKLRGELEAPRHGFSAAQPMHFATLWVWSALVRTGAYGGKFGEFKARDLVELEPLLTEDEQRELEAEGAPDPT